MGKESLEKLSEALGQIDRPGTFCVGGSVPFVLPGLDINGLGLIGLPLAPEQAKEIIKRCAQAPYGKGTKTIVDTTVRRVWRMEPDRFSLKNPEWESFIKAMVKTVQAELGLESQELESHLYDLLLYEPGSFFLPHRDGEKLDRMVATLVVVLPSLYEGGEIVVRHDGEERTIDFGDDSDGLFYNHFVAFYADCEHEVRPVRKGYRLCLVYNLTLAKSENSLTAPRVSEHIETISPLLRQWATDDSAGKLVITLDHQYTQDGLAWDALKGVDRVKARVLAEAARQAGCKAYLGLLTFWESGSAEYSGGGGYRSRYGRGRWDDVGGDAGHHEMGEIYDTSLTVKQLSDDQGNGLPIGELSVEKDEILDSESLTDVDPEENFEGYTGNAGMTLERWYRHAAILIWPEKVHLEIVCDRDSRKVIPVLNQMVERWRQSKGEDAAIKKTQCIELASALLARWNENPFAGNHPKQDGTSDLLQVLAALDDPQLISDFLGQVLIKDASVEPGESLAAVCQKYSWATFQQELLTVIKSTTIETMERNVRLLEQICSAKPRKKQGWAKLCEGLAKELVAAVEIIDQAPAARDWRSRNVRRSDVLAGLARALITAEQFEPLSRVVDHALASPQKYPLMTAHIPALLGLRPWLEQNLKKSCHPLRRWLTACRQQLESLTARAPEKPADFRREATIKCKCADCAELKRFLADPTESVHRFSVKQERRNHLGNEIREHKCDVELATDTRRSPHTLICTKNVASYQESMKKYQQDQEHLATVRSMQAGLPK